MKVWAVKFLSHPKGLKILEQIVYTQTRSPMDFSKLVNNVEFFTSPDLDLWSYAGVGTIYINFSAFEEAFKKNVEYFNEDYQKKVLLLAIACAGLHAIALMALRKASNDLNLDGYERLQRHFGYFYQLDCGLIAQFMVFRKIGAIPNWFGLMYCDEDVQVLYNYVEKGEKKLPLSIRDHHMSIHYPIVLPGAFRIPPLPPRR